MSINDISSEETQNSSNGMVNNGVETNINNVKRSGEDILGDVRYSIFPEESNESTNKEDYVNPNYGPGCVLIFNFS